MHYISLAQVLNLVGHLDDSPGNETPRERFRTFLQENINDVGQVRAYVSESLEMKGTQYNRALQDLVNHLGHFLGFAVTFGRYQGVSNDIGFDGHWQSPTGFHMVVEVKTTEVYAIKTATLVGYVDNLVSDKRIPSWDKAIGLYIVGTQDPQIRQLENAVVAERRTDQLRVIGVDSLLSLADMMSRYGLDHKDILALMRPSEPSLDSLVELMSRLVVGSKAEEAQTQHQLKERPLASQKVRPTRDRNRDTQDQTTGDESYWLTPVRPYPDDPAAECVRRLVVEEQVYAYSDRTPGRKRLRVGDWLCFYVTDKAAKGVIAHARVASLPEYKPHPKVRDPEKYPWAFQVDSAEIYPERRVAIDAALRARLHAFSGKDPGAPWAWFVQGTKRIDRHDFLVLTGRTG